MNFLFIVISYSFSLNKSLFLKWERFYFNFITEMNNRKLGFVVDLKGRKVSELSMFEFYELMDLVF